VKVVFLHGIGEGDPDKEWLSALNHVLEDEGYPAIDSDVVIAPRYATRLGHRDADQKMPPITYKAQDETRSRREFERRQARVHRKLQLDPAVGTFGFHVVPDAWISRGQSIGVDRLPIFEKVRNYVENESVRASVLNHILAHLPGDEDVVLIAHSLGSVVAIDLLDHLPKTLHVRRFLTLGSPANSDALHKGHQRLLKKFPYARVDDWSNFFSVVDPVTKGRGLASMLPGAQDFRIDIKGFHSAKHYLSHPAVVRLVAEVLYPSKHPVPARSDVAVRLTDEQAYLLLQLHFAKFVAKHIKDDDRAHRFKDALKVLQDDLAAQLRQFVDSGQPVAAELHSLIAGNIPDLPQHWEIHEAVLALAALSTTNFVSPYEIETDNAPRDALPDIVLEMGLTKRTGEAVAGALTDIDKLLKRSGGIPWGRIAIAGAGLALLAAGPIGLVAAAPASAFGAAAVTGGLAAFGPGGMVGGLAMLGGLTGSGAAVAAGALAARGTVESITLNVTQLKLRVAADLALKRLGLPIDNTLWEQLTTLETQISAELNRLETFSDSKASRVGQLNAAKEAVIKLLGFVVDERLGGAVAIE
jgi:pimeloyl-ACP methyl ester carboxylesterase